MNMDRSPTAEGLFERSQKYEALSAGTNSMAVQRVSQKLVDWADKIFVMSESEDEHLTHLRSNFNLKGKEVYDLGIPDEYRRGSKELVDLLKKRLAQYVGVV